MNIFKINLRNKTIDFFCITMYNVYAVPKQIIHCKGEAL